MAIAHRRQAARSLVRAWTVKVWTAADSTDSPFPVRGCRRTISAGQAGPVGAGARGGPAVPAARERPACATILPPNRRADRRCAACARAAQEPATGREEAAAALQAPPMAALPATASARRSWSTAAVPRAAGPRSVLPARPLLPARPFLAGPPFPPAPVSAAPMDLRPAGPSPAARPVAAGGAGG